MLHKRFFSIKMKNSIFSISGIFLFSLSCFLICSCFILVLPEAQPKLDGRQRKAVDEQVNYEEK